MIFDPLQSTLISESIRRLFNDILISLLSQEIVKLLGVPSIDFQIPRPCNEIVAYIL